MMSLNKICDIQETNQSQEDTGQITDVWSDKYTDVKCRCCFQDASKDEQVGEALVSTYKFYLESLLDIGITDRIYFENEHYEILSAKQDSSNHHWSVITKKRNYA